KPGNVFVNKLQALVGLIEVSIQSVRQISTDLRPAVLDHLGLPEAIQWEATKFEARTGIRCRLSSELTREFRDRTRALALFRIVLVDDHPLVRQGIKQVLAGAFHPALVGEASSAEEGAHELNNGPWDVVVLDLALPGMSGLDWLRELRRERPSMPVLILSMYQA